MLETQCEHCFAKLKCLEKHLGKRIRCPKCGHEFRLNSLGSKPILRDDSNSSSEDVENRGVDDQSKVAERFNLLRPALQEQARNKVSVSRPSIFARCLFISYGLLFILNLLGMFLMYSKNQSVFFEKSTFSPIVLAFVAPLVLIGILLCYLLPSVIAYVRDHRNSIPIFIVNLFFGWTLLGWVICLAWAFSSDITESRRIVRQVSVRDT